MHFLRRSPVRVLSRRAIGGLILGTVAVSILGMALPPSTLAGPDACVLVGGVATCTGDQSGGIYYSAPSPSISELNVNSLTIAKQPIPGIFLYNINGSNTVINSGTSEETVSIFSTGNEKGGILGKTSGAPSGTFPDDPFLGVPLVGVNPAVSGGYVAIHSYSDITTNGKNAHGIYAESSSDGYPDAVITKLESFKEEGFAFEVIAVRDLNGQVVAFGPDATVQVSGFLLDENGNPVKDGSGNIVPHGTFVIGKDGTYTVSFTDTEKAIHNALNNNESLTVCLDYTVKGERNSNTREDSGHLFVVVGKNDVGDLEEARFAKFDTFGFSTKPSDTNPTIYPDLKQYVDNLLANAISGGSSGSGGSVTVNSDGAIETRGEKSHGIYAYSIGGTGAPGKDSTFYLFYESAPTVGGDGKSPGPINVTANGSIITTQDQSSGVMALSAGGTGGAGGDGVGYRDGRRGGTGGDGGQVEVHGSANIETEGDYASGIIALSVGGNGGAGGSTGGAMSGGNGGYGGKGGIVSVEGDWNIKTAGDKAHGIWAKSLGGNAGDGGSGGWLFGKPGGGGQATDGGSVTLHSGGEIETSGESSYGLYAQSVGGFGGSGGSSWGLFWSFGGDGNSGGSGGDVDVANMTGGRVTTSGDYSHAIFAQSIGGGGGSGGGEFALIASLGGEGAAGGFGGYVHVENDGWVETSGTAAHGIFAQSVGGGGGDGGSVSGMVAIGGVGSETSDGGDVDVINRGTIITHGSTSHAIFAESIGGGGGSGGRSGGLFSIGGSGGGGGDAGNVSVFNEGALYTHGDEAYGIFAQSIGGGGGSGGGAVSLSPVAVGVSIGGSGGGGGDAKAVEVYSSDGSSITTEGDRSYGIFAQSVGGGGGDGGFAITAVAGAGVSVAVGGNAAKGGDAGTVDITMDGSITTYGEEAYGIFAQSVGGGGGAGGFAIAGSYGGGGLNVNLGLGGDGGGGGIGDAVNVDVGGTITTFGQRAYGILAQSVGGSGGDGGFAIAGSIGGGTNVNLAFGGKGGVGNTGGDVNVSSNSSITTQQDEAHGIFAQSIGGSGGAGGFSVAASLGGGTSLNLAIGGDGGVGSSAGKVTVGSETTPIGGDITTHGDQAYGILAQSVGGGGGAGGAAISGALLAPAAITLGFGGEGGTGGLGGTVDVYSAADITTHGSRSHGILAQSVGGGGGAGGLSIAGGVTAFGGLSLAMGGKGGGGNTGGDVAVFNSGSIETNDEYSYGIFAQSVGGGGGAGGSSGAVMVNFSSLIPIPPEYPTGSVNIALSLGGDGGTGGHAGTVKVDNTETGTITTQGDHAYGIFAQSVGGGGGDGGKSIAATANISMPSAPGGGEEPQLEVKVDFAMAIGGDGGAGGDGKGVEILNRGLIDTSGIGAHGIFAQSVGGGGGSGGDARSMILSIDPSNWSPSDPPPDPTSISVGATLSMGGKGNAAGDGGTVVVTNDGTIITRGADAFGILAQSVGGGGGVGGSGYHGLDLQDFGVPEEYAQFQDLLPVQDEGDLHITVGGSGGAAGNGSDVKVKNTGDIITFGDGSLGILAQSIGGGGGLAGIGATGGDGSVSLGGGGGAGGKGGNIEINLLGSIYTEGVAAHGIFAQSVGGGGGYAGNVDRGITDFGINVAMGGGGGDGGAGGNVSINSAGNIVTLGNGAVGIFAQSVGGGGGLGGEVGFGFGFAGSVGGVGDGGRVEVVHTGNITTYGQNAHGIFAQSVGGADYGGDVVVRVSGDITVYGEGSLAVIAQSEGSAGKKNINVIYEGGTITGGTAPAVNLLDGLNNAFTNYGTVTTAGGINGVAVLGATGNETINNHGRITGSVDLGAGVNAFHNFQDGVFDSGTTIHLGSGNTLINAGILSPGGSGTALTTILGSNLVQTGSGTFEAEVYGDGRNDKLVVNEAVSLDGNLSILRRPGFYTNGTRYNIMENVQGINGMFSNVLLPDPVPLLSFDVNQSANTVEVEVYAPSVTTVASNRVEMAIANYLDRIIPSATGDLLNVLGEFQSSSSSQLGEAFSSLSPDSYDDYTRTTLDMTRRITQALQQRMLAVRSYAQARNSGSDKPLLLAFNGSDASLGQFMTSRELSQVQTKNGLWFNALGQWGDQDDGNGYTGYDFTIRGATVGFDHAIGDHFMAGVSIGHSRADIDLNHHRGEGYINSTTGSLYGSYFTKNIYVDGVLSYGGSEYDNDRLITIGSLQRNVHSTHDGDLFSAYLGAGYTFDVKQWLVGPFVSLQYIYLDEEGFREQGADSVSLIMDGRETDALVSELGLRVRRVFETDHGVFVPELSAAWLHDFDMDDRVVTASFAGSPGSSFSMKGQDVERNGATLGAGIIFLHKSGLSTSLKYRSEFREDYRSHGIMGELRFAF